MKATPLVLLMMIACGPGCVPGEPLSSFASGTLDSSFYQSNEDPYLDANTVDVTVSLSSIGCLRLSSDVRVSLNGMPMENRMLGGPQGGFAGGCDSATFGQHIATSALGAPTDGRVEVKDASGSMLLTATGFLARRALAPRQSLSSVSRGQSLVFDWIPSDDGFKLEPQIFFNPVVNEYYHPTVTRTGSVIEAIVPDNIPSGPTHLQMNITPDAPIDECTGVATCMVDIDWEGGESTSVAP